MLNNPLAALIEQPDALRSYANNILKPDQSGKLKPFHSMLKQICA